MLIYPPVSKGGPPLSSIRWEQLLFGAQDLMYIEMLLHQSRAIATLIEWRQRQPVCVFARMLVESALDRVWGVIGREPSGCAIIRRRSRNYPPIFFILDLDGVLDTCVSSVNFH